ncbi:MAG: hypothetical protein MJ177_09760 [Clostridia bacterium]|nr:hypothetical protein [Clostridia bacterium]
MMHSLSVTHQFTVFVYSLGAGFLTGIAHTLFTYRISNNKIRNAVNGIFIVVSDFILYCFYLLTDMGKIRLYGVFALFLGFAVHKISIKKSEKAIDFHMHNGV